MRSLIITPAPTHPADQGNRARVRQVTQALQRRGSIELLYAAIETTDRETLRAMAEAWDVVHVVPPSPRLPRRRHPDHWGLDDWVTPQLVEAARALDAAAHYDVVVVNYVWYSRLLDIFRDPRTVRVLDTHDVFGDRHRLMRASGVGAAWYSTTPEEEARGLSRADVVLAIQPAEAAVFAARSPAQVRLLEYACPPRVPAVRPSGADSPVIGYFGSANPWNVTSLLQFDRLLAARSDLDHVRFVLLGGISGVNDAGWRRFQPMGRVAEVQDVYDAVDAIVNPMMGGTGLKIKTVEALAHGRALFSTRDGGAGLEECGPDLTLPNPSALADRLAHVLATPGGIETVAADQRRRYAAFYDAVSTRLADLVDEWARGDVDRP